MLLGVPLLVYAGIQISVSVDRRNNPISRDLTETVRTGVEFPGYRFCGNPGAPRPFTESCTFYPRGFFEVGAPGGSALACPTRNATMSVGSLTYHCFDLNWRTSSTLKPLGALAQFILEVKQANIVFVAPRTAFPQDGTSVVDNDFFDKSEFSITSAAQLAPSFGAQIATKKFRKVKLNGDITLRYEMNVNVNGQGGGGVQSVILLMSDQVSVIEEVWDYDFKQVLGDVGGFAGLAKFVHSYIVLLIAACLCKEAIPEQEIGASRASMSYQPSQRGSRAPSNYELGDIPPAAADGHSSSALADQVDAE